MARGDGDTTSDDTSPVSPSRPAPQGPPVLEDPAPRSSARAAPYEPLPQSGNLSGDGTPSSPPSPPDGRYRRCPGWASRWVRGRVLATRGTGAEVVVTGSAAVTWMALDPSSVHREPAPLRSPSDLPMELAPSTLPGATAAELVDRIELGWPDVGPVTIAGVEAALAMLTSNALVERVPSPAEA